MDMNGPYLDRRDNKIKNFDSTELAGHVKETGNLRFQWPFAFQQAVDKLPPDVRHSVHIRILLRLQRGKTRFHAAEEKCICDSSRPHSCVATLSVTPGVQNLNNKYPETVLLVLSFHNPLQCNLTWSGQRGIRKWIIFWSEADKFNQYV